MILKCEKRENSYKLKINLLNSKEARTALKSNPVSFFHVSESLSIMCRIRNSPTAKGLLGPGRDLKQDPSE